MHQNTVLRDHQRNLHATEATAEVGRASAWTLQIAGWQTLSAYREYRRAEKSDVVFPPPSFCCAVNGSQKQPQIPTKQVGVDLSASTRSLELTKDL